MFYHFRDNQVDSSELPETLPIIQPEPQPPNQSDTQLDTVPYKSSTPHDSKIIEDVTVEIQTGPPRPRYKPSKNVTATPIHDNFGIAASARSPADLPSIPTWNKPGKIMEPTPLLIGFTRNWLILQQSLVSYITAGWPPEEIYIIDNSGTMDSNAQGLLSLQNPFFLDYHRLTNVYGVNVVTTPTLLTFAQLQNFYLHTAKECGWLYYFWSHMDTIALPDERQQPFKSLYHRAIDTLHETIDPSFGKWAIRFFAYDRLALVNTAAYTDVGGWDTMIPFYGTDCDMHERLAMAGYSMKQAFIGLIYDVGTTLPDLSIFYRPTDAQCNPDVATDRKDYGLADCRYESLVKMCDVLQIVKNSHDGGRNFWQGEQTGGHGEPFYRDPDGFEIALQMHMEHGKAVMAEKWGHRGCDLRGSGLDTEDAWRVLHDWE